MRDYCLPAPRYCSRTALDVELQLLPAAGGQPRTLVAWKGYDILDPAPSPDGRSILFVSNRSGNRDIWSVPVGGGEPVPFVANPFDDFSPQFSPDGSQVLFTSVGGSQTDLWVMPSAGGPASALTNGTSSAG